MGIETPEAPAAPSRRDRPRSALRSVLNVVLSIAVAAALLVGVLPAIADFSEVWAEIRALAWFEILVLFALATWNLLTYQFVTMAALPGLPLRRAFMVGQISTAVSNTVPAGSAVGVGITYAMFSSYGYSTMEIGLAAALTGVWNVFIKLGLPFVALALVAITGQPNTALISAATVGLAVLLAAIATLGLVLASDRLAGRIGNALGAVASRAMRPFKRGPYDDWGARFRDFRRRTSSLLRRRWHWLTGTSILSHLSLFALLLVSLRLLGVEAADVSGAEALAAFAVVRLVTALPITPGGLGVVELGLTAALALAGGPEAPVVAAVLVYRALTYALQIPIGLACWIGWRAMGARRALRA